METKHIIYKNFNSKNKQSFKKKLTNSLNFKILIQKYPLLKSLTNNYDYSFKKKYLLKFKKYDEFNLIGMGGSILGAQAIYDFLGHKIKKKFHFYNNLKNFKTKKSNKKRLNIIISKSGNTLETLSNLNLILTKQKKNKNLIITENKNNILRAIANKLKSDVLDHKNYIGGRYSVLSEVGMVPAELMGLNEKKFKRLNYLLKNKTFINFLIKNVSSIHSNIIKGKKNCVILNYDEKLNNFLKWYQQLSAESLGKNGKGFFPIISTMPKDNHSLLQLYLDGPKNNFFSFFISRERHPLRFNNSYLTEGLSHLKKKNLYQVLYAQTKATQNVFNKKNLSFRSFEIINKSEETLGELFTFFILETLMLSSLLNVNPINQPSVELIKIETKKILK
ncbi:glucose-6-phosphate isomerase [Candidatus Pelagibacter sp.]|nr:glucose-6-phosphate isomerase [Candidatus Pelagibacter sp.]